jgi:hypothetical protein
MSKSCFVSLLVVAGIALAGCNSGDERLKETADFEGKIVAEAELRAEYEYLAKRSGEMERDLNLRQKFYQGVRGTYEGTLQTEKGVFSIRFTLVPSLPPFPTGRVRALDEVVYDLNNLHFNVQVVQWNPSNKLSAVGCRFEKVRPDLVRGEIHLAAESCPNLYVFQIGEPARRSQDGKSKQVDLTESAHVASMLMEGKLDHVARFFGRMQPTTNADVFTLDASRVEE